MGLSDELIGTWELLSFKMIATDGEELYPWGHDVTGRVTFDADGRFAAQMMKADRPPLKSSRLVDASPEEAWNAFTTYYAYYGTYSVDEREGSFTNYVEGSLLPNWGGGEQKRWVTLEGDRATFTTAPIIGADGGSVVGSLQWRKLPGSSS